MAYTDAQLRAAINAHERAAEAARSPAMNAVLRHAEAWQEGFDMVAGLVSNDEAAAHADAYARDLVPGA